MPWKVTCAMKERLHLISLYQTGKYSVTELAGAFGVSRKTAHKWLERFRREGFAGLEERSRAPHHHPNATPEAVVAAVLQAKEAHPTWGPAKLLPPTHDAPDLASSWPAPSTRGSILARHGLVTARRRRRRTPPWTLPFQQAQEPNALWCADFKGWVRTADGTPCHPLTITDAFSRMLLACQLLSEPDAARVRPVFEGLFRRYGLPQVIRTDNGTPFASVGAGGLTSLSAWWVKLGIVPERIAPGHPEQNGRHERMHRTLKAETMRPPAATMAAQQRACDAFRWVYNTQRPHQALGQVPPATHYQPSPRRYPPWAPEPCYPPLAEVRRVRSNGQVRWQGGLVFVSEALVGEVVGITEEGDHWLVSFGPIPLGWLRPHAKTLERLPLGPAPSLQKESVTYVHS